MTIRRAAHFVPGANEKMLNKSLETEADALILDLEDAVTPENKDSARVTSISVDKNEWFELTRWVALGSNATSKKLWSTPLTPTSYPK